MVHEARALQTRIGTYCPIRSSSSVSFVLQQNSWSVDPCRSYNHPESANVPRTMTRTTMTTTTIRQPRQQVVREALSSSRYAMYHRTPNGMPAASACSADLLIPSRDVPKLANSPPPPRSSIGPPNPRYILLRSFVFHRSDWKGYEHRMTKGERSHGQGKTGLGGEDRTWEFTLAE